MLKSTFKKKLSDDRAIAATEFAIIFPILIMFMIGSVEAFNYFSFQRQAENAGASLLRVFSEHTADPSTPGTYTTSVSEFQSMKLMLRAIMSDIFERESYTFFMNNNDIDIMYVTRKINNSKPQFKWFMGNSDFRGLSNYFCSHPFPLRPNIYPFTWTTFPENLNPNLDTIILKLSMTYVPIMARFSFVNVKIPIDKYFFAVPRYVDTIIHSNTPIGTRFNDVPYSTDHSCS